MDEQFFITKLKELSKEIHLKVKANFMKMYEPYDLTMPQVAILCLLKDSECEKVSNLSNALNTPDSNISAICNRLEKRKLITKARDLNDQRVVYVRLTQDARDILAKLEIEKHAQLKALKNITSEDMESIVKSMEKLSEMLGEILES